MHPLALGSLELLFGCPEEVLLRQVPVVRGEEALPGTSSARHQQPERFWGCVWGLTCPDSLEASFLCL